MPAGVKIRDLIIGDGEVADRDSIAIAHIRGYLRRGDECCNTYALGMPEHINVSGRDQVAGVRKGIVGMRVGGRRELIVSPHLAYGEKGAPPLVPPNAVIRFEVELVNLQKPGGPKFLMHPPGKHLLVFHPGEAARNLPRWQFGLNQSNSAGAVVSQPIPGLTWRHARVKNVLVDVSLEEATAIFQGACQTFEEHRSDCMSHDDLWADSSEKANSITRDRLTNSLCITVTIFRDGDILLDYSLPETSPVLLSSVFYRIISEKLLPHLLESRSAAERLGGHKGHLI
jgi:hypothetical protein